MYPWCDIVSVQTGESGSQWAKVPAAESDNLRLTPGMDRLKADNRLPQLLCPPRACHGMSVPLLTSHTN